MTELQKAIANSIKLRLDALAETGTIQEINAVINTAVDMAIAIEKLDPKFNTHEFLTEIEIS